MIMSFSLYKIRFLPKLFVCLLYDNYIQKLIRFYHDWQCIF